MAAGRASKPLVSPQVVALEPGAREHYADPGYYSHAYRARLDDVAYYRALVLKSPGIRVLEYGAGNGRITLELARAGAHLTAVDTSLAMLADLQQRLRGEAKELQQRVHAVPGDMRERRFRAHFDLILAPFNTVLHLYTRSDMERFLMRVRRHLAPRGAFVFDYSLPRQADLTVDPNRWFRGARFRHPSTGEVVAYAERFHYAPITQILSTWMRFSPLSGAPAWETRLTHRQYFPQEIAALLHYNGFTEQVFRADFRDEPLRSTSDTAVVVCRAAEQRPTKRRQRP